MYHADLGERREERGEERGEGEGVGDEHKEFIRYYQERGSSSTPLVVAAV